MNKLTSTFSNAWRRRAQRARLSMKGRCNICGKQTSFYYDNPELYRESLCCGRCWTTSRYRSIARGILCAVRALAGPEAESLAELRRLASDVSLRVYDTQVPFYYSIYAYPMPDLLRRCPWLEIHTSLYRPQQPWGAVLGRNHTNQNLERLTFPDASFDIVITSDVMEHVRLDELAHREICRVLKPGGIYLFTVPHFRHQRETLVRVLVTDPADPSKDVYLMEKEYHGDANSEDDRALCYRVYGTELDEHLSKLGLVVDYTKSDFPESGILNTELFYCRRVK